MIKKILLLLLAVLVIIQFFPADRNQSAEATGSANDISSKYPVPREVRQVLKVACYDCHSNTTAYPWYASIQPVAWWLQGHVREGKRELNFNEFSAYRARRQFHKMEELEEQIKEEEMPLWSYTLLHKNARLSPQQKQLLIDWSATVRTALKNTYPPDSLIQNR